MKIPDTIPPKEYSRFISFRCHPDLLAHINRLAERHKVTRSRAIVFLLTEAIKLGVGGK
jgi:hypothetical protein